MQTSPTRTALDVSLDDATLQRHPGTRFALLAAPANSYASEEEARAAERALLDRLAATFADEKEVRARPEDDAYRAFYRAMGLKAAQVSTPVKQAARVVRSRAYAARGPVVDAAMRIEYASLVSFQVYDADKLPGDLCFRIARGDEPIVTTRGEEKLCKPGELVLVAGDQVVHSCYYGNHRDVLLDTGSTTALVRAMAVPGIAASAFADAVAEAEAALASSATVVLGEGAVTARLQWEPRAEEVPSWR